MIQQISFHVETKINETTLVHQILPSQEIVQIERMYLSQVPLFLTPTLLQEQLQYKTNDSSLETFLQQPLTKTEVVTLVKEFTEAIVTIEEAGLQLENLVVDARFIYINCETMKLSFVYLPVKKHHYETISIHGCIRQLVNGICYDEQSDLHFFVKLHNSLRHERECTIDALKKLLTEESACDVEMDMTFESGEIKGEEGFITSVLNRYEEEETEAILSYLDSKKKIVITNEEFVLGRDPLNTHYTFSNGKIGRVHATISKKNGCYYVKDNHSTNGTYLNGMRLTKGDKVEIKDGDLLAIADQQLRFQR